MWRLKEEQEEHREGEGNQKDDTTSSPNQHLDTAIDHRVDVDGGGGGMVNDVRRCRDGYLRMNEMTSK